MSPNTCVSLLTRAEYPAAPRPLSGVSTETLEYFLRPCDLIDIKADPRFHQIYRDIWNDLLQEVWKSHERNR
jgi:hypothetical protein